MIEEEPQYDVVLKMVLWGESRETIMHRLKVNGIEGDRAEAIFSAARRERIATIRNGARRDLWIGLAVIAGCLAMIFGLGLHKLSFTHFSEGAGTVLLLPWLLSLLAAVLVAVGLWRTLKGAIEILLAPTKEGSVADD